MSEPGAWPAVTLAEATARLTAPGAPFEMAEAVIRGVPTRIWKNAPPTLRDLLAAGRAHGVKTFLVHEGERATFDGFARAALAVAEALAERGIVKGDRVAIGMRNLPEWPVAFFGATAIGAIAVPLNAWWTAPELAFGLQDSGARVAILDGERFVRMRDRIDDLPGLAHVLVARGEADHPRAEAFEAITGPVSSWDLLPDRRMPEVPLSPEDDATIFYTSGTTGKPKGALGSHRAGACGVMAHPYSLARSIVRRGEDLPAPDPTAHQKASLIGIPFFHVTGCFSTLTNALYRGSRLVMMRRFDPVAALELIERERVTTAGGVPTIAMQLVEHPERENFDLSSLETVSYGGAPAPGDLVRRIREELPSARPATGWGMTETSATFTHFQAEDYEARPASCGPPLPVCDVRIVDADGRDLPAGEVGELWARGPMVVTGYWKRPEATAETFSDGWLRTGDLARADDEGFLEIVDRAKDMLIRGGENIYCIEVESALVEHPMVMDAGVVGLPHPTLGEEPAAVVTLIPEGRATEDELRAHVAARLAAFKVPVRVLFHPEILPRNPNGKILKAELRELFG